MNKKYLSSISIVVIMFLGVFLFLETTHAMNAPLREDTVESRNMMRDDKGGERADLLEERQNLREENTQDRKEEMQNRRCEAFSDRYTGIAERMDSQRERFMEKFGSQSGDIAERRTASDEKLTQLRVEADVRRNAIYTRLEERTQTQDQQNAVEAFRTANEDAVRVRRESIDNALEEYRNAIDDGVVSHLEGLTSLYSELSENVSLAYSDASKRCEEGDIGDDNALRNQLKSVYEDFRNQQKNIRGFSDEARNQMQTKRSEAVEEALDQYRSTFSELTEELKMAFSGEDMRIDLRDE